MRAVELKECLTRLQEINVALSELYNERGRIQAMLFTDPQVGPVLVAGGEVESLDGYKVKGEKKDAASCSEWERKNAMKSPAGDIIKLKLTLPKGEKS